MPSSAVAGQELLSTLQLADKSSSGGSSNTGAGGNAAAVRSSTAVASETTATTNVVEEDHQLSQDLQKFLENPSLKQALADGSLDLSGYGDALQQELATLEDQCIQAYSGKAGEMNNLQGQLQQCDQTLALLEELLLGFQADLGGLSGDIRQLQDTSKQLGIQLANRQGACAGLRSFLERIVISPTLAQTIAQGKVNANFVQAVQELQDLLEHVQSNTPQEWAAGTPPAETVAGQEMLQHLQQLQTVAIQRIRQYFLQEQLPRLHQKTNIRMIQSHGLVPYAPLYQFLVQASPSSADQVVQGYCQRLSKTLVAVMRTYHAQLMPLDQTKQLQQQSVVVAVDDALLRDVVTTKTKHRIDVLTVGDRAKHVWKWPHPVREYVILAHVASQTGQTYPYERLFQSILIHLVNAITNEHVVCRQLFGRTDLFSPIFGPTIQLVLEQVENTLFGCPDAIALLLMIQMTHNLKDLLGRRHIDDTAVLDQLTALIWPRLQGVVASHARSLQQATPERLGTVDIHAHYVSRRFAEFTCSMLLILQGDSYHQEQVVVSSKTAKGAGAAVAAAAPEEVSSTTTAKPQSASAGDLLLQDLNSMLDDYFVLLDRLADSFSNQKSRIIFAINNLDAVVSIFHQRKVASSKHLNRILEKLIQHRDAFVEEELLSQGFSKMIAFLQQTEAHLVAIQQQQRQGTDQGQRPLPPVLDMINIQVVESLVRDFASSWKQHLEDINRNVLSYFSNFRNGMEILKQVLTQLLLYYTRFQDVLRKVFASTTMPSFCKELVPTTVILAEIKKYALSL